MLRYLNKYEHGFVGAPIICLLEECDALKIIRDEGAVPFDLLCEKTKANSGYLKVSLGLVEGLGWIRRIDGDSYEATDNCGQASFIPRDTFQLYEFSPNQLVLSEDGWDILSLWLKRCGEGWHCDEQLVPFFDGPLLAPLLIGLFTNKLASAVCANKSELPEVLANDLKKLFLQKKWATDSGDGLLALSGVGKFMLGRSLNMGVTVSYRPLLARLRELHFGDPQKVFTVKGKEESHVDRSLNVQASGFQHEKYFADMAKVIEEIFNQEPLALQPRFVADTGCGDGTLLKHTYELIREKTLRGQHLNDYPISLIGLDYNNAALQETGKTLEGLPHQLLFADVGDPERILRDLSSIGVEDSTTVLHLRSFLDHNRPYKHVTEGADETLRILKVDSVSIAEDGKLIPPGEVITNLIEHFRAWKPLLMGHGVLCLEVHAMSAQAKMEFFDMAEGLHFDALHAFSLQHLVDPHNFLLAAAQAGLFSDAFHASYPRGLPYTRITLDRLVAHPYSIRYATLDDSDRLAGMKHMINAPNLDLKEQVDRFPEIQFLMERDDGTVAVAVISELIGDKVKADQILGDEKTTLSEMELFYRFFTQYLSLMSEVSWLEVESSPDIMRSWEPLTPIGRT